jgi:hypothetical protein
MAAFEDAVAVIKIDGHILLELRIDPEFDSWDAFEAAWLVVVADLAIKLSTWA